MSKFPYGALTGLILIATGCNRTPVATDGVVRPEVYGGFKTAGVQTATEAATNPIVKVPTRAENGLVLPSGTSVRVRLARALDTKRNRAGDPFSATLDEPLMVGERVAVPRGTTFAGHVVTAAESGRFKRRAVMALRLDSFSLNGVTYDVNTNRPARLSKGHKKRNWLWIGGGSGGGAAIGALAGGGAGALIGAGAGAAAGTVGAAFTGKRHVVLPVESRVTFSLQAPVAVGG